MNSQAAVDKLVAQLESATGDERDRLSDMLATGGGWFGAMGKDGVLEFALSKSRPSDRAQAALDELVRLGLISVEPFNSYGGLVYRPLVDFRPALRWMWNHDGSPALKWEVTASLKDRREAKAVQQAALRSRTTHD